MMLAEKTKKIRPYRPPKQVRRQPLDINQMQLSTELNFMKFDPNTMSMADIKKIAQNADNLIEIINTIKSKVQV